MVSITANELKTKGVSVVENALRGEGREQDATSFANLVGSATIGGVSRSALYTVTEIFQLMISSTRN